MRRVVAAVAVTLMLAVGTGHASALFRCQDEVLRTECCCPNEPTGEPAPDASVDRASCCDVEIFHATGADDARAQPERLDPSKARAAVGIVVRTRPVGAHVLPPVRFADHPPVGRLLVLVKHSFLL